MEQVEGCYGCRSLARRVTEADATIAALQADNRTYINERHENMKQIEQLQADLAQRTAELEAVKADRDEAIREHGKWILSYKDLKRLYEAATRARKRKAKGVTGEQHG